jgi:hypothetical protein
MGAKLMVDADSGFLVHPADHQQLQIVFLLFWSSRNLVL